MPLGYDYGDAQFYLHEILSSPLSSNTLEQLMYLSTGVITHKQIQIWVFNKATSHTENTRLFLIVVLCIAKILFTHCLSFIYY